MIYFQKPLPRETVPAKVAEAEAEVTIAMSVDLIPMEEVVVAVAVAMEDTVVEAVVAEEAVEAVAEEDDSIVPTILTIATIADPLEVEDVPFSMVLTSLTLLELSPEKNLTSLELMAEHSLRNRERLETKVKLGSVLWNSALLLSKQQPMMELSVRLLLLRLLLLPLTTLLAEQVLPLAEAFTWAEDAAVAASDRPLRLPGSSSPKVAVYHRSGLPGTTATWEQSDISVRA